MKQSKIIYLTAFFLSLCLILLLEASSFGLLAEDIKHKEKKEVKIELLLSASNNSAGKSVQNKKITKKTPAVDETEKEVVKSSPIEEREELKQSKKNKKTAEKKQQFLNKNKRLEEKAEINKEIEKKKDEPEKENQKEVNTVREENLVEKEENIKAANNQPPEWLQTKKEQKKEKSQIKTKNEKFNLDQYLAEIEQEDIVDSKTEKKNDTAQLDVENNEAETKNKNENNKDDNFDKSIVSQNSAEKKEAAGIESEQDKVYDLREANSHNIEKPGIKNYTKPVYPSNLRKRNIEGKLIISLRIDKKGQPHDLKINQSSGYQSFDQAALKAVLNWEFKAAEKEGQKVEVLVNLPIRFNLN